MNKTEFVAILRDERVRFEELLTAVGSARMATAGVSGHWSVKDIVAHVEAYERALVTWLQEAQAGRVYVDPLLDRPDLDVRNAAVYEANRSQEAAEILQTFRQTWDELVAQVELLTEEELTDAGRSAWFVVPRWGRPQSLWQCIANDSYEHHQQHIPDIQRWLAKEAS